jgi:hypothetical protein
MVFYNRFCFLFLFILSSHIFIFKCFTDSHCRIYLLAALTRTWTVLLGTKQTGVLINEDLYFWKLYMLTGGKFYCG